MKVFVRILMIAVLMAFGSCDIDSSSDGITPPNFEVLGLYDLVEINVSTALDLNEDGTASTNILNELDCASGVLLIDADLVWTLNQVDLRVNEIPIDDVLFSVSCEDNSSASGTWFSNDTTITFFGDDALASLQITANGDRLISNPNEQLPGFLSLVYERRITN